MSGGWSAGGSQLAILLASTPAFALQAAVVWGGILLALVLTGLGALWVAWLAGAGDTG